jgi:hypothetical protein
MGSKKTPKRELLHLLQPKPAKRPCPFEFASGRFCQLEAGHENEEPHSFEFGLAERELKNGGRARLRLLELAVEIAHGDRPAKKPRQPRNPIVWVKGLSKMVDRGEDPLPKIRKTIDEAQTSARPSPPQINFPHSGEAVRSGRPTTWAATTTRGLGPLGPRPPAAGVDDEDGP